MEAPRVCLVLGSRNHVCTKHALPLRLLFAGCRSWLLTLHLRGLTQQPCRAFTLFTGKKRKAGLLEHSAGPHSLLRDVTTSCQSQPVLGSAFCIRGAQYWWDRADRLLLQLQIPGQLTYLVTAAQDSSLADVAYDGLCGLTPFCYNHCFPTIGVCMCVCLYVCKKHIWCKGVFAHMDMCICMCV